MLDTKLKTYTIEGLSPGLLMHSDRGLVTTDPDVRELKTLTAKRSNKRTDEDNELIQQYEFRLALYHDPQLGPYIPSENIEAALRSAATAIKMGAETRRSLMVTDDKVPLEYDGPRDIEGLWQKRFYDVRGVKVQRARTLRTRPHFEIWRAKFTVQYDPEHINEDQLDYFVEKAGQRFGIGDFRPRYGRFEIAA